MNFQIPQLTSEGGRLKRNIPLVQGRDFVLIPDSLWKVLQQWYGGAPALPRQVCNYVLINLFDNFKCSYFIFNMILFSYF